MSNLKFAALVVFILAISYLLGAAFYSHERKTCYREHVHLNHSQENFLPGF